MVELDPVTPNEILALYEGENATRVWSPQQVAERVWRNRGGEGEYDKHPRLRNDVPQVVARHVRPVLRALSEEGVLCSAVGDDSRDIGVAFDGPVRNVRYFGRVDSAERIRAQRAAQDRAREQAKTAADQLRQVMAGQVTTVRVSRSGVVTVELTADQTRDLLARLQAGPAEAAEVAGRRSSAAQPQPPTFLSTAGDAK